MAKLRMLLAMGALVVALTTACGPGEPLGSDWNAPIEGGPRPAEHLERQTAAQRDAAVRLAGDAAPPDKSILFGDLHVHTSYSWDAFLFSLPLLGGEGVHPPADACDFARYCSNLDFFALTDHAEALRAEHWEASKQRVRECNALAGDPDNPDLVAFMGFEWTQMGLVPEDHWGHRCVVFPGTGDGELPARPIASADRTPGYRGMGQLLRQERAAQPQHQNVYDRGIEHLDALVEREVCPVDVPTRELPLDCLEIAASPAELHAKLDEWGLEAMDIPHGTAWGIYTPATTSIDKHLDAAQLDPQRQRVIEIMSGHGNSEEYREWRSYEIAADGSRICPEPTEDFLPCCWQAGEIIRSRCGDLPAEECEARVVEARELATRVGTQPTRVVPQAAPEEWLDCGQCRDCFKPAFSQRPRETVQYAMALSNFEPADPLRFRYGFIASSDIHDARAGVGYKQTDIVLMTDTGAPRDRIDELARARAPEVEDPTRAVEPESAVIGIVGNDPRTQSFLYAGGLAAVHASGRSREAIWQALDRREVYGTSGPRILLWFDLLNGAQGRAPMGSEHVLGRKPVFEVRAVGSFEPRPGCPDWARQGLSAERLEWLCRDECHHPGETRRPIERIEIVRIRPQERAGESVAALIEDPWLSFECEPDPNGCSVRFEDAEFPESGRDALYYARALEGPSQAINGQPLSTQLDDEGRARSIEPCGSNPANPDCLGTVRERAWSSPIFVDQPQREPGSAS